ncbi:synaptic vesicle glycoprotein 2B isoform X1 [Halyomorpha halys]|uniref:synaptic vesicle glycoprotein 2B isoform X1 n=2 Tax=Halyomorpha halys TaxID=286706 RepID=UPI0006D4E24A|nr:synaptic vesicle glycoprotein 2B isoform X1 [Halyomorpha halys]
MLEKKGNIVADIRADTDLEKKIDSNRLNGKQCLDLEKAAKCPSACNYTDFAIQGKNADFEEAIELAGYGKFHYFLLIVCGFVSTSEEMDVISMSFLLPSAQCDLELSTYSKGWLNSIIFIGMMLGAYFWGSLADTIGRRKVLIVISFMNAVCIVISSLSQSFWLFMLFRFLNGAALGGSGPVVWSYFAEFQPKKKRGSMLSFMAAFWTLGNLFVASLAWSIIPSKMQLTLPGFIFNSWRVFLMICSIPSFLVAGLLYFLPESPKFLISSGKSEEALKVFQHIYNKNTGKPEENYPILSLVKLEMEPQSPENGTNKADKPLRLMLKEILAHTRNLFIPPILRFTIISVTINFTFHIGYYGLMMWFPELFNRFDEYARSHGGLEEASVCEVTYFVVNSGSQAQNNMCDDKIESSVFLESFITVAAAVPSNILAILGMDSLGRKFFLVFSTVTSGLCAICMFFVYNKTQNLIVSAIFSGVISCGNAALDCLITEIFPTNLRATGVAISMVAARLGGIVGNIVIATLLDMYCPAPTFIVAALLIGGGLLCLFLPNTTRVPLS